MTVRHAFVDIKSEILEKFIALSNDRVAVVGFTHADVNALASSSAQMPKVTKADSVEVR